ncbi:MAG: hypothetical protein M1371_11380 [Actinobacteria bacterium]|nr:hypothetical protein [Actinomycetota bacterium]
MRVVAFFNLKKGTDFEEYKRWTRNVHVKALREKMGVKDFKIYEVVDIDGDGKKYQILQIAEFESVDGWRRMLEELRKAPTRSVVDEWLKRCDEDSTVIYYGREIA